MKTRNGFVSNSSSSSFVLLVKKEDFDIKVKELTPLQQAMAEEMFTEILLFGEIPTMSHYDLSGNVADDVERPSVSDVVPRAKEIANAAGVLSIHPGWGETEGGPEGWEWDDDDDYASEFFWEVWWEVSTHLNIEGKSWSHSEHF